MNFHDFCEDVRKTNRLYNHKNLISINIVNNIIQYIFEDDMNKETGTFKVIHEIGKDPTNTTLEDFNDCEHCKCG